MLFFAWNGSQTFEDLEAKQSVMMLRQHTHFYINNWGVRFHDYAIRIFCNGWIDCRDAFHVVFYL